MKKGTWILLGSLAVILFTLAYCKSQKPLFYEDNGNYFVDNNFIIKKTAEISADDVKQLIELDADPEIAKLTKGVCFLLTTVRVSTILRLNQLTKLDRVAQLTRYTQIQRILDINKGCFELQQIDWAQFGDLKARLDKILTKYNPATVQGNVSIVNNQIATSVAELRAEDISQLNALTVIGVDEINICGDYMGPNRYTRLIKSAKTIRPDEKLTQSLNKILTQYK